MAPAPPKRPGGKVVTPVGGVAVGTLGVAADEFAEEDLTPVNATSFETIEHRSKLAVNTIITVRDEVRAAVKRDEEEHKRIHERVDKLAEKVDKSNELAVAANAKLDLLVPDVQAAKASAAVREKVTIETAALVERTTIEDTADAKRTRRERNLKIVAIIGTALGTGGFLTVLVAGLMSKC